MCLTSTRIIGKNFVMQIEYRGCRLSYQIEGEGAPVVFIQGAGLHGSGWIPQTQSLSAGFQCLTFDNRGIGASQSPAGTITIQQMAADTIAIMDQAGIASAHLAGHSLGGLVAQHIGLTAQSRVLSLALLCTSSRGADALRVSGRMIWLGTRTRIGTRRMRRRAFLEMVMSSDHLAAQDPDRLAAEMEPIFGHDLADTPPVVMSQLGALKRYESTESLRKLSSIPTLVLSASQDIIFPPACGRALAEGIGTASFIEIPKAAHGVTIQCAAEVNRHLSAHWRSIKESS